MESCTLEPGTPTCSPPVRGPRRGSYPKPRRRTFLAVGFLALAGALLPACQTVPVTGRVGFNMFSSSEDIALGGEAYSQILAGQPIVSSGPDKDMVERAMQRLTAVADVEYAWEVTLIDDDQTVNAFALPGGKMAVYTGILPVCQTEQGLAVVMGHEIGHVVARHGTERMTQTMGLDLVLTYLDAGDYAALAEQAAALLFQLPFSRKHESEADHIGLIYMARAGYDPSEAVAFWQRMDDLGGGGPPEFLSTHPSHDTRVSDLNELLPEALAIYRSGQGP